MLRSVAVRTQYSAGVHSERVSRSPEIAFSFVILLLVAVRLTEARETFGYHLASDWAASDWMIRYSAGFVRRGLGGSFLAGFMHCTGLGFFSTLVVITTASYLILCAWLLRATARVRAPSIWRFALLFNPILLISACDFGTLMRKDVVFLLATLLTVWMSERSLTRQIEKPAARVRSLPPLVVLFALLSLTLALLHEGIFTFIWLPLNAAIVAFVLLRSGYSRTSALVGVGLALLPSFAAVAASVYWHGNVQAAQAIFRSWRSAMPVACTSGSEFPAALGALAWSLRQGLSLSLEYAKWFPLYPVFLLLGGTLQVLAVSALIPTARLEHLLTVLVLPFVASLPLYVLGVDWGRWLSLVATGSLLVMLSPALRPCVYETLPARVRRAIGDKIIPPVGRFFSSVQPRLQREAVLLIATLILIPMPPIPERSMILLDPPFVLFAFLRHLVVR